MIRRLLLAAALSAGVLAPLATPTAASAQVGASTDILTGRVTGPDGKPLENVEVSALSAETGITRRKRTGADGRYTILFPDGGGQYRLEFKFLGFDPVRRNVVRQGDEDRFVTDVQLGVANTQRLTEVQISGRSRQPQQGRQMPSPGESGGALLGPDQLARMPIDQSDLAAVAAMAAGVVPISASDSSAAAFSVAGQRSALNNVTLDGLSMGNFTVPAEGLRGTRVITNTYDPSRGKFTGGEVSSSTKGGTNEITGGFTYSRRDPTLQFEGSDTANFSPLYLQDQISAGLGGPLIKDKLFANASMQFRRRSDPFQSLLSASPGTLQSAGISPDSVSQFLSGVSAYGIPITLPDVPGRRIGDQTSGLLRVDYLATDAHTLTFRLDYSQQTQDPTRTGAYSLPTNTGTSTNTRGGIAITLSSVFENGLINEFRSYYTKSSQHSDGFLLLPTGRVRVTSELADGTQGVSVLTFGGNPAFPQAGSSSLVELTNELSYLTRNRAHRIKLGALLDLNRFKQDVTTNRLGTFTYNSLDDFLNNVPSMYTRSTTPQQRVGSDVQSAIYLGDTWRPNDRVQIVYGLRGEGTHVGHAPLRNTDVEQRFGVRTDRFPSEVHVSPRAGFSINLTKPNRGDPFSQFAPPFLIRGGIGEFRAPAPTGLYTSAQVATGLTNTERYLSCVGAAVPAPNWANYLTDPTSTPVDCLGGTSTSPTLTGGLPTVTVFGSDFQAPRAWRGSLGVQRRLVGFLSISADASYARGTALYGVTDLNLRNTPAFTLTSEGNRPVYSPASAIVPTTGAVALEASRNDPTYGQVLQFNSNLKSDTRQLTLSLNGGTMRGSFFRVSYTLQRTNDQSSFNCCSASQGFASPTTSGNPNIAEYSPGDNDIRQTLQAMISQPITQTIDITANIRLSSGRPFTPMVDGDINGDGARNDRAFVFDPATTANPSLAAAMQQLLNTAPQRVKDCLESQFGKIAGRNSCRGPVTPSLDMQMNWKPTWFGPTRQTTISLVTSNVLAGLDQVLHKDLRGWGQPNYTDPTLLYVRGFDPSTNTYLYDVNGRFGSSNVSRNAFRVPFVVSLQVRLAVGPDQSARWRQTFANRIENMASGNEAAVLNPIVQIIQMRDTLGLTDPQVGKLTFLSDTLAATSKQIAERIRDEVNKQQEKGGNNPQAMFGTIRPMIAEGRQAMMDALDKAKLILTPEQWAKVPESIKNPPAMFGPGSGRGGPGGGPGGGRRGNGGF